MRDEVKLWGAGFWPTLLLVTIDHWILSYPIYFPGFAFIIDINTIKLKVWQFQDLIFGKWLPLVHVSGQDISSPLLLDPGSKDSPSLPSKEAEKNNPTCLA